MVWPEKKKSYGLARILQWCWVHHPGPLPFPQLLAVSLLRAHSSVHPQGIVFLCQGFYSFTRSSQHPMADQGRGVKTQSPSSLWDVSERLPSSRTSSGVNWGSFGSWGAVQFLPLPILLPHTQEQCSLRAPFNKHHEDTFWSQNLFLREPDLW